jgi:hypothetical protein
VNVCVHVGESANVRMDNSPLLWDPCKKNFMDTKGSKSKLTMFLLQNSFYTIDEYFELKLN